jgi:D-alanyl-D-alanine carboxypeptidase/D-alanyl-D-alanine-endopeptidase (penicillin-binding protein 4)
LRATAVATAKLALLRRKRSRSLAYNRLVKFSSFKTRRPPLKTGVLRWRKGCASACIALSLSVAGALPFALAAQKKAAAATSGVAQFSAKVTATLSGARDQKAFWGILVVDRDSGKTLYELNADHFFAPASNAKMFVTSFALAALGPDYKFRTTLESQSPISSTGELSGDLLLVGRGDPDLSNRVFPYEHKEDRDGPAEKILGELADLAIAKGLKQIDGDIVADDTYYPYDPYPEGWSEGDIFFSYGAPVDAIALNDNIVAIDVLGGTNEGDPAVLTVSPDAARDGFDAQVTTGAPGSKANLAVVRQPGPNFILLRGTVPPGGSPTHVELAITQPAEVAGRALKQILESRGITVRGTVRALHSPPPVVDAAGNPGPPDAAHSSDDRSVLAEHFSPPLLESVRLTNKISQNLHAEMYLRELGRQKYGTASTAAGLDVERDFLKTAGIADGDVVLADASGLSPQDLVTPRSEVTLLRYAQTQPWGAAWQSTLPISGVDGTLEKRFTKAPALGMMHAKTGSITNVRAVSGYATSAYGASLVFCIMVNANPQHGLDATSTLDAIATAMIETLRPAPSTPKRPAR